MGLFSDLGSGIQINSFWVQMLLAVFCGGILGIEREVTHKPAGIRTNILICVGAALFAAISKETAVFGAASGMNSDPARIAAQVVSGVGFLGAGAIIQSKGNVFGLTTAATIWVVAAIGVAIGMGYGFQAFSTSVIVLAIILSVRFFKWRFFDRKLVYRCKINITENTEELRETLAQLLDRHDLEFKRLGFDEQGSKKSLKLEFSGSKEGYKHFLFDLWALHGVTGVAHR